MLKNTISHFDLMTFTEHSKISEFFSNIHGIFTNTYMLSHKFSLNKF